MSYRVQLIEERTPGEDGTHWLAVHPDLPGCHALGREQEDALAALDEARETWLRIAQRQGGRIPPEPELPQVSVLYLYDPTRAQGVATRDPAPMVKIGQPA